MCSCDQNHVDMPSIPGLDFMDSMDVDGLFMLAQGLTPRCMGAPFLEVRAEVLRPGFAVGGSLILHTLAIAGFP